MNIIYGGWNLIEIHETFLERRWEIWECVKIALSNFDMPLLQQVVKCIEITFKLKLSF